MRATVWKWTSLILLCWAIASSVSTLYFYNEYRNMQHLYSETLELLEGVSLKASLCIDYGNGTREWHNETVMPIGATLFNLTLKTAKVKYDLYPGFYKDYPKIPAVLITSINGVESNKTHAWLWWYWDQEAGKWAHGMVGCNHPDAALKDGGIYMWRYEKWA